MNVDLRIDKLVIEATASRRPNAASLKAAIERELALLIEANGLPSMMSGASKIASAPRNSHLDAARGEARLARDLAQRIYRGMKR